LARLGLNWEKGKTLGFLGKAWLIFILKGFLRKGRKVGVFKGIKGILKVKGKLEVWLGLTLI